MRRMPVRGVVSPASSTNQSLAQRLHDLRAEAEPKAELVGPLYADLFLKHFGTTPRRRMTMRDNVCFGRMFAWCLNHDVSVPDFISANMLLLKGRLGKHQFQPNMLVGPNAEARYNGVLGRANRRFHAGTMRVFDSRETWRGRIRANLIESEQEVAELFCSLALADDPITWDEAAKAVRTNQDWRDFQARVGCFATIVGCYGRDAALREGRIAQLSAAWSIAEKHRHGLADCLGVTDFSWGAFVRILRHVERPARSRPVTEFAVAAGGRTWGNWS